MESRLLSAIANRCITQNPTTTCTSGNYYIRVGERCGEVELIHLVAWKFLEIIVLGRTLFAI